MATRAETHATAGKMSAVGLGDAVKLVAFHDGDHSTSGSSGSNTPISLIDSLTAPGTAGGLSSKDQSATDTAATNAHSSSDAAATGVSGGNFESLTVGSGTATANVTDTVTPATVDLTASTVNEGSGANYVFTATLSNASEGVTTIHTDQGDITIADGATTGTLDHCLGQRRGRLYGRLQPDGAHHRRLRRQLREPHRRQRHGDRQRHRHRHPGHRRSHRVHRERRLWCQLRVHGDAVECLGRRHHHPHRPGRYQHRRRRHHRHA